MKCKELKYNNIYVRTSFDKDLDIERKELGFLTNRATKPLLLYSLSFVLGEMGILVYSDLLLKELRTYPKTELDDFVTIKQVRDGTGKHFDRVMALALAREGMKALGTTEVKTEKLN